MRNRPLVSIVTPTYNQAEFVAATIESVLGQTYSPIEYIVINDGSTDETPNILERYRTHGVRVIHQRNIGQTATINKGWALSKGAVIAWLNSDDLLAPYAVEEAVNALQALPGVLGVHGNAVYINKKGETIGVFPVRPFTVISLLLEYGHGPFSQPATFFRREVLDVVGFLDQEVYYCMDFDYWARVSLKGEIRYIDSRPWAYVRVHPSAKSSNPVAKGRAALDFIYVYHKIFAMPHLPVEVSKIKRRAFSVMHWHAARRLHRAGHRAAAIKHLLASLAISPETYTVNKVKRLGRWLLGMD